MEHRPKQVIVGVDVGGTFTDIVVHGSNGNVIVRKVLSTPEDPGKAILDGLAEIEKKDGISLSSITEILHGTTVATNAVLEHKGAATGLITTQGFRDVLEIARIRMPVLFDLGWDKPVPLVPRRYRVEVVERLGPDGSVIVPINMDSVSRAVGKLVRSGIQSIAICLLHSYRNPIHEEKIEEFIQMNYPNVSVSCSHKILPEIKEYERTSTTVVNAYVRPKVNAYLQNLRAGLTSRDVHAPIWIMGSNGGVMSVDDACWKPVTMIASGPAAGVSGSERLASHLGWLNVISFDMGGTTAKAALIEDGKAIYTSEYEVREGISTPSRFIKAGGYLLQVPAIDIAEVGSGGGSIAWIDSGGALRVGPQSAGAEPGPVCYDRGGLEPTVTDANLVLGYMNPTSLAGGTLRVNLEKARLSIEKKIAVPLQISVEEAAWGIRRLAVSNMIRAVRSVTVERGRDPRSFTLIAFGGAGPLHAVEVAQALEIYRILVPRYAGIFTAVGLLGCDVKQHFVRTISAPLTQAEPLILDAMRRLEHEAKENLKKAGFDDAGAKLSFTLDMRYEGQSSEIPIHIHDLRGLLTDSSTKLLHRRFMEEYEKTYGYTTNETVEVVNIRLEATGIRRVEHRFPQQSQGKVTRSTRRAYFGPTVGWLDVEVIAGFPNTTDKLKGPLIVETYDSTVLIPMDYRSYVDSLGNLVIERR